MKTEVIPVGLEVQKEIKEIKYLPENAKHIIHVGGFTFEKNHSGLLRIFQRVLKIREDVYLHLVGDGPLRAEVEALVREMDLTEKVHLYGFVNNPLSYIKGGDVLVLPSIIEGLPGVLLEGMYCSTPVVAYDVGGISEILNDNTGILLKMDDEENFATAILEMLQQPNQNKLAAARRLMENEYMNSQVALKFVKSYQNLLGQKV